MQLKHTVTNKPEWFYLTVSPTKYVACVMVKCQSLLTMEVNVCMYICIHFGFNKAQNMHIYPCGNPHHPC